MIWIALSERDNDNAGLKKHFWDVGAKCEFRSASVEVKTSRPFVIRNSSFDISLGPACGSGGMFVQSEKFVESHGGTSINSPSLAA